MQYRELREKGFNAEFSDLYKTIEHSKLREIITTLHFYLTSLFRTMNERLPTGEYGAHFWAAQSRDLISIYVKPIFKTSKSIVIKNANKDRVYDIKQIGEGSYANVYKYKDTFYNRNFIIKRAKKDLSEKELLRFKREYEEMKELSSPYILEVYRYLEDKNEYIMEYMDYTLDSYIAKSNTKLSDFQRKGIAQQVLRAFKISL